MAVVRYNGRIENKNFRELVTIQSLILKTFPSVGNMKICRRTVKKFKIKIFGLIFVCYAFYHCLTFRRNLEERDDDKSGKIIFKNIDSSKLGTGINY